MAIARLLDMLYNKLEHEGLVFEITRVDEAKEVFDDLGIAGTFDSARNLELFKTALAEESLAEESDREAKIKEWEDALDALSGMSEET